MMKMGDKVFGCDKCKVIHPKRFIAYTVKFEGNLIDVCIICDREDKKKHDLTHCKACDVEVDYKLKRVRDPDTKNMINVCSKCFKDIKK